MSSIGSDPSKRLVLGEHSTTNDLEPKVRHPHRLKILLSYDGSDFGGWQRQKHGLPTAQETLEIALSRIYETKINVMGAGRTDAGVHALGQVAHADVPKLLTVKDMARAIGSLVPDSMVIEDVWEAPADFNANRSSFKKTYRYLVHTDRRPDSLRRRYTYWYPHKLDIQLLNEYSKIIVGKHDFKSFQNAGTPTRTTTRHIYDAQWKQIDDETVEFVITGNGFLKQMVRNIVGTMIGLNKDCQPASEFARIVGAMDRRQAGKTAAPQGLYLCNVYYPAELDNRCRKL